MDRAEDGQEALAAWLLGGAESSGMQAVDTPPPYEVETACEVGMLTLSDDNISELRHRWRV